VIDGEAVLMGVDGVSDFNRLHSRRYDLKVKLYAFDILSRWRRPKKSILPIHGPKLW
jgi:ATP-dependent DNA ligase